MLHVKSCNVKHNSESAFHYFANAVNSNQSTKCNRKDLHAICSLQKVGYVPLHTFCKLICLAYSHWAFKVILHSLSARPDGIYPAQIHLIGIQGSADHYSIHNKEVKFIYEFTLWGRDLQRFCLKKIYENFVETLETVCNVGVCIREESVLRGLTVVQQEIEKSICGVFTSSINCPLTEVYFYAAFIQ